MDFRSARTLLHREPPSSTAAAASDGASLGRRFACKVKAVPRFRMMMTDDIRSSVDRVLPSIEEGSDDIIVLDSPNVVPAIFDFDVDDEPNTSSNEVTNPTPPMTPEQYQALKTKFTSKITLSPSDFLKQAAADFRISSRNTTQPNVNPPNHLTFRCCDGFEGTEVVPNGPGLQLTAKRRRRRDALLGSLPTKKDWDKQPTKRVRFAIGMDRDEEERGGELSCFRELEIVDNVEREDGEGPVDLRSVSPLPSVSRALRAQHEDVVDLPLAFSLRPLGVTGRRASIVVSSGCANVDSSLIPEPVLPRPRAASPFASLHQIRFITLDDNSDVQTTNGTDDGSQDAEVVFTDESMGIRLSDIVDDETTLNGNSQGVELLNFGTVEHITPDTTEMVVDDPAMPTSPVISPVITGTISKIVHDICTTITADTENNVIGSMQILGPETLDMSPAGALEEDTTDQASSAVEELSSVSLNDEEDIGTIPNAALVKVNADSETVLAVPDNKELVPFIKTGKLEEDANANPTKSDILQALTKNPVVAMKESVDGPGDEVTEMTEESIYFCPESAAVVRRIMDEAILMDEGDQASRCKLRRYKSQGNIRKARSQSNVRRSKSCGLVSRTKGSDGRKDEKGEEEPRRVLSCFGQLEMMIG